MGCASAKHVATVQNEEEAQKGKNYQNGDVFGDEYRIKPVEEVKYMKNGAEEEQKIAARNQENLEKSASSNVRLKTNKEIPGLVHQPRANMHISESQQEFFRMLDEKIEKILIQEDSAQLEILVNNPVWVQSRTICRRGAHFSTVVHHYPAEPRSEGHSLSPHIPQSSRKHRQKKDVVNSKGPQSSPSAKSQGRHSSYTFLRQVASPGHQKMAVRWPGTRPSRWRTGSSRVL
ncbi:hypothetical protein JEQ12_003948 [Ovis aries]|uniref:Uncharacterized protein n=1 Tax=Ovis aries TaxID=9940 RepID=A0A836CYP9_SHEEP|nr:hypothetical protein JEQ12_003948 [Ovis aries]